MEKLETRTLRFFIDTEFNDEIGDMRIELISIAIVSEDGAREFYAECSEFAEGTAHPWLHANVIPKLGTSRLPVESIRDGIKKYLKDATNAAPNRAKRLQFWAKNGANDFALLGLIFGGLSKFYEFVGTLGIERTYFNDTDMLRRESETKTKLPRDEVKTHHALFDARHERLEYKALQEQLLKQK